MIRRYDPELDNVPLNPHGEYVKFVDLESALFDLRCVTEYLQSMGRIPLTNHIMMKYQDDFERIERI